MNWKPAFKFRGQDDLGTNAQVFATKEEALDSARERFMVWTMPEDYTAIETDDPVNYTRKNGWDEPVHLTAVERCMQ